jgi:hypothetical protein
MTATYSPIIECVELRRLRLGSPLQAPAMGTVLVLECTLGEPIVVASGQRVPNPRAGKYRRMYRIDVATKGLGFTLTTPSSDAAFPFTATVAFACRVTDPVAIARDNVNDMTAALSPSLGAVVRDVAGRFDAMYPVEAAAAITAKLNAAYPPVAVELSGFSVTVTMPDTAEILTTRRSIRVREMRRDDLRSTVAGGREGMILDALASGTDPMSIIDRDREDKLTEKRAQLAALSILKGESTEDIDATDIRKQVLSEFFPGDGSLTAGRTSMREKLEKRTKASLDSGRVVEGTAPADTPRTEGDATGEGGSLRDRPPTENGQRQSRVRGTLRPTQPTSEDR